MTTYIRPRGGTWHRLKYKNSHDAFYALCGKEGVIYETTDRRPGGLCRICEKIEFRSEQEPK